LRAVRRQEASVSVLVLDDYETFQAEKGELRKSLSMFVGPDVDVGAFVVRQEIARVNGRGTISLRSSMYFSVICYATAPLREVCVECDSNRVSKSS
jgi:hypothetical protein